MKKVLFSKALTSIGYTEIFRECSKEELKEISEYTESIGYPVKFYRQKVEVYNFFEARYIERHVTYIVWDERPYFNWLKEGRNIVECKHLS